MRYRRLSDTDDYTFGQSQANFLVDSREMVAQSIKTRLRLWTGEWFLDVTEGMPWMQQVVSAVLYNTKPLRDMAIRLRVLQTPGVTAITRYESTVAASRRLVISMDVDTTYGRVTINGTL